MLGLLVGDGYPNGGSIDARKHHTLNKNILIISTFDSMQVSIALVGNNLFQIDRQHVTRIDEVLRTPTVLRIFYQVGL